MGHGFSTGWTEGAVYHRVYCDDGMLHQIADTAEYLDIDTDILWATTRYLDEEYYDTPFDAMSIEQKVDVLHAAIGYELTRDEVKRLRTFARTTRASAYDATDLSVVARLYRSRSFEQYPEDLIAEVGRRRYTMWKAQAQLGSLIELTTAALEQDSTVVYTD